MKILCSPTSPYSSKVRMAAHHVGLQAVSEFVKTDDDPANLVGNNPLGKIPVLLTDDGEAIFDSRAIMQYLNRESGGKLYPSENKARTEAEVLEALADGITDCLLACIYERRFRPPEKQFTPWLDRQWSKVARGLDHLQANPPKIETGLNGEHFALAGMAGYLALRFAGQWEDKWPVLTSFIAEFTKAFPAYEDLKPQ